MTAAVQLELNLDPRRRYTGHEAVIDWDYVSGMDFATKPELLRRWIASPERKRQDAQMKRWGRRRMEKAERRNQQHRAQ